jgi:hypothetical protein
MAGFGNLGKNKRVKPEADKVFSGGFGALDSQVLDGVIEVAYLDKSKGGATSLTLHVKHDGGVFKTSLWLTGGDKKGNNNFYTKDGEDHYLPGFIIADHIALIATGDDIGTLCEDTTTKAIKVRDFKLKADVNKEFETIEELQGQEVSLGIVKSVVDKKDKVEKDGKITYVPNGETREENEITKVFSPDDGRTVTEMIAEAEDAEFITEWKEAYDGKVINKAKGAAQNGSAGAPAKGNAGASDGAKKKAGGIFNKNK